MLEGRKINMAAKPVDTSFKSSLNFDTVKGTGIPSTYNSNKVVQEIKNYDVQRLADGWKKGVVRKNPSADDKKLFQAIVIVLKYKHGTKFPQGMEKI